MKKVVTIVMIIVLMVSCNSAKNGGAHGFSVLASGTNGGSENFSYIVLENDNDLAEAISKLPIEESDYDKLLNVNFKENNVLILHLGQKNTGGYGIEVEDIQNKNNVITVFYKIVKPKPGEMVTMALTNPFTVAAIPKAKETLIKESK
ncbi:protease complex subunit PrcB family protein [Flavobacterium chuncheonense]|uniref:Protease complex subunit PrcB family protein n=1 Tax=Flavobacterium chuncheonense TaxID=2026653 RepID=A0ABW5YHQ1_9FLAO